MATTPSLNPAVLVAREKLQQGRLRLREQHDRGSPGIQVCAGLTELFDEILMDLYQAALQQLDDGRELPSPVALVAHAGYGRSEIAPYSDVDLMLLCAEGAEQQMAPLAQLLNQFVFDSGLQLGLSTRTPRQAWELALKEPHVLTSLVESRLLSGDEPLFQKFMEGFRRRVQRRHRSSIQAISQSRREEQQQWGGTVYLLKPNIKRSRGGLRDLQLIRWIGFARYGEPSPERLMRLGHISREDWRRLQEAREYLLRIRNEMHFHADRVQDNLDRAEQVRIADLLGFSEDQNLLPIEHFMREYFDHTRQVHYIATHFLASTRTRSRLGKLIAPLNRRNIGHGFWMGPVHIGANAETLPQLGDDLEEVLRLMGLANRYNRRIDHVTWRSIRDKMSSQPDLPLTPETADRFLDLLSRTVQLGDILRRLHELRVLERIIPAMTHARCLLQFNEYHKYTVDEHSIRAVEIATDFSSAEGTLGEAYRSFRHKRLLHLALLMHDLGKGYSEDHSEVGRRIVVETVEHFPLSDWEKETLEFLVHKHLLMAHTAFRQNVNDPSTIVQFAAQVGSTDVLQALYVLTCADLAAVGPDVFNDWKSELLAEFYLRTRQQLTGEKGAFQSDEWARSKRDEILTLARRADNQEWWQRIVEQTPHDLLASQDSPDLFKDLEQLAQLGPGEAAIWSRHVPERNAMQYIVGADEKNMGGMFHRLTGVLSDHRNQILSAEIHRLGDGHVLDRFFVQDMDFAAVPPATRRRQVEDAMQHVISNPEEEIPPFKPVWQTASGLHARHFNPMPTRVSLDNATADNYTILTIFAYDRMGLLYLITHTLYELELEVHLAKIATYLDQVVDVFYLTSRNGEKIEDEERLKLIRRQVKQAIMESDSPTA